MSQAVDDLRHEHDAVLVALGILDKIAAAAKGNAAAPADLSDFLQFLQEFVDKCHHGKEERLLFPAMVSAGMPEQAGPIAVMLAEHGQGRDLVDAMRDAISPTFDPARFAQAAQTYADHMRQHIDKENGVLFPMAERILPEPVLAGLAGEFAQHEEQVIGHGRHEELHTMLHQLKARYS